MGWSYVKKGLANGPRIDGEPNEVTRVLLDATVDLAKQTNEQNRRHTPSPSSVEYCTRRNWFAETGVVATELPDAEAFIAAESGRMTESLISRIVNHSSLGRVVPLTDEERELIPAQYKPLNMRGGQFDQMLVLTDQKGREDDVVLLRAMALGIGPEPTPRNLLEYKRKSVYDILNLHRQGLLASLPGEYQQVQVLLKALKLERCLYIAVNWDRSALTRASRGKERPPGLYAEWIEANPVAVYAASERAKMQSRYILTVKDAVKVPKDFNNGSDGSKADWQCMWCPWRTACWSADGKKRKPGQVGRD